MRMSVRISELILERGEKARGGVCARAFSWGLRELEELVSQVICLYYSRSFELVGYGRVKNA